MGTFCLSVRLSPEDVVGTTSPWIDPQSCCSQLKCNIGLQIIGQSRNVCHVVICNNKNSSMGHIQRNLDNESLGVVARSVPVLPVRAPQGRWSAPGWGFTAQSVTGASRADRSVAEHSRQVGRWINGVPDRLINSIQLCHGTNHYR